MRNAKALLCGISAVLVIGCSSTPTQFSAVVAPSIGNVDATALLQPGQSRAGHATAEVFRDAGFAMGACAHDIFVNDVWIASLRAGEGARFAIAPGRVRLRLNTGGIVCPPFSTSTETEAAAGESFTVRSGVAGQLAFLAVIKR